MNTNQQTIQMLKVKNDEFQQSQANQLNLLHYQQQQCVNELIEQIESMDKQLEDVNKQLKSKQNQLNNKFNQIKKLKNEKEELKKQLSESQQVIHNSHLTITYSSQKQIHHQHNLVTKTTQPPSLVPLKKIVFETEPVYKQNVSPPPLVPLKKTSVPNVNDEDKQFTIKSTLSYKPGKKLEHKKNNDEKKLTSMPPSVIQFMNTNVNKNKGSF
ncbi:hypothetical protein QTN25_006672 [Entamoeba marina]